MSYLDTMTKEEIVTWLTLIKDSCSSLKEECIDSLKEGSTEKLIKTIAAQFELVEQRAETIIKKIS
jgi:hypothetical protein